MSTVYIRVGMAGPRPWCRAPVLEGLLASAALSRSSDWRGDAFRTIAVESAPLPPIGPTAVLAAAGAVRGVWACVATPVHLVAGMTQVTMPRDGCVQLRAEEAQALAADFNHVFKDAGVRLMVGYGATLLCVFDQAQRVFTRDPQDALECDVFAFQPTGVDAPRLRRLASEIEMWLFEHAVNRARASKGLAAVTGLWLWGGGGVLPSTPAVNGWTAGDDPLFSAFGPVAEWPSGGGSGVVVSTVQLGSTEWLDAERRWLAPAASELRSARLRHLTISAGEQRFDVRGGLKWRFWRRARPWWESIRVLHDEP
jgi:hypothetical protein